MLVPPWLESLLSSTFFTICPRHRDAPRNECNMYCLDCMNDAFCFYCRSSRHKDHPVIQIRRSSYHDVVRVAEVQKVLDISEVQTYVINSARVVFLNERPQPKGPAGKGVSHLCEVCGRSLLDPFRFCSLGCKLAGIRKNGDATFIINSSKNEAEMSQTREGIQRRLGSKEEEEELREGRPQDIYGRTPPPPQSNSRRRKGIPHRAPFGT
ncbi:protein RGF1 INDUCIBLE TRANSCRIPTION FACTOR 1 [Mangifera indica]|uniref:protein RGF1 INDUCIBLE TRANSCRIPTION FACTOR 1 n=1 Tax=Mangifera indica TaxID=29780 RepID=UPI001CFAE14E|nr:protein RGF1 INDUCIBLE TRANSCRIPTION FACTOR 1 [Mangifera indica]XP_044480363.1 protein RGF1 INDUCIBLE TRANSCRIPTION FACTOR 1 [Mangifera indica]XP_044480364.1 protein RGF1 INDUCIBLE TRANSCRIPTION FACTOR 1 [Mangifera indica]